MRESAIDYSTQAPGKTLITFDVDGTLIKAVGAYANKFHKDAFAHAFKIVHGLRHQHRRHRAPRLHRPASSSNGARS